jgi:hypothetical protein
VRFEVLMMVNMKILVLYDVIPGVWYIVINISEEVPSVQKMKAGGSFKMLVTIHQTIQHHIPEDSYLQFILTFSKTMTLRTLGTSRAMLLLSYATNSIIFVTKIPSPKYQKGKSTTSLEVVHHQETEGMAPPKCK